MVDGVNYPDEEKTVNEGEIMGEEKTMNEIEKKWMRVKHY